MSDVVLQHREASGSLSSGCWEYDPARKCIVLVVRVGSSSPICLDVDVCSSQTARHGAYHLRRVSEGAWRIMPAQYLAGPEGHLTVSPTPCVDELGAVPILLTMAPEHASREMASA